MKKRITIIALLAFVYLSPAQSQSISYDKRIGDENAAKVALTMGIYDDPQLTQYIQDIGKRLVDELVDNPFEYEFLIVDEATPNAFALPGGHIYITRGLLALAGNIDELGCVMGHEIIHVHNRHSVKQMKSNILPAILQVPGRVVGAFFGESLGALVNAPVALGTGFFTSKYSRKHETESDTEGAASGSQRPVLTHMLSPLSLKKSLTGRRL